MAKKKIVIDTETKAAEQEEEKLLQAEKNSGKMEMFVLFLNFYFYS